METHPSILSWQECQGRGFYDVEIVAVAMLEYEVDSAMSCFKTYEPRHSGIGVDQTLSPAMATEMHGVVMTPTNDPPSASRGRRVRTVARTSESRVAPSPERAGRRETQPQGVETPLDREAMALIDEEEAGDRGDLNDSSLVLDDHGMDEGMLEEEDQSSEDMEDDDDVEEIH